MTATTADLKLRASVANAAGYAAFGEGRPAAPSLSPVVRVLVADLAVGDGATTIFEAFTAGYRQAADEACAALLADDDTVVCDLCDGSGKRHDPTNGGVWSGPQSCSRCLGSGRTAKPKPLPVIPATPADEIGEIPAWMLEV